MVDDSEALPGNDKIFDHLECILVFTHPHWEISFGGFGVNTHVCSAKFGKYMEI